jgi:hypothetical protein
MHPLATTCSLPWTNVSRVLPNYVFKPTAMRHFVLTNCRRVAAA